MAEPELTVGLFCRVSPAAREILAEVLRGMKGSRRPGDPVMSLGALVERCIVETLGAAAQGAQGARKKGARRK